MPKEQFFALKAAQMYSIHLMSAPEGNSEFCFPESLNVSRDEVEGKQNPLFPEGADIKYFVI